MTDPQTWTLISGFLAITVALNAMMLRVMRVEIRGLGHRFDAVDARFDAVHARFDAVDTRFDAVDRRLDGLDRDVAMLVQRAIDEDR